MENFAHTLLGLSLAKAGLERATPLATTALVVASNLPDVDVLPRTLLGDTSAYLEYHRGFTHSFVGLILGSAVVWLTTTSRGRGFVWLLVGVALSLVMALALHQSGNSLPALPTVVRVVWFVGLLVVVVGTLLGWGRYGERLARYSLMAMAVYYGGMWMAHQSALRQAASAPPAEGVRRLAAWPTPANPALWQAAAVSDEAAFLRPVHLRTHEGQGLKQAALD